MSKAAVEEKQVHLDVPPAARALPAGEGPQDADGRKAARDEVRGRHTDLQGLPAGLARDRHQPRPRLREQVESGQLRLRPDAPAARDRRRHQTRVLLAKARQVEAKPRQAARQEVLDENVGPPCEKPHRLAAGERSEVESNRLLVPVDRKKVGREAALLVDGRPPTPRHVALPGMLDFDHPGSQIPEQHRAVRAREHAGQIEDEDSLERGGHYRAGAAGRQASGPGTKWKRPIGETTTPLTAFETAQYWSTLQRKSAGGSAARRRCTWR